MKKTILAFIIMAAMSALFAEGSFFMIDTDIRTGFADGVSMTTFAIGPGVRSTKRFKDSTHWGYYAGIGLRFLIPPSGVSLFQMNIPVRLGIVSLIPIGNGDLVIGPAVLVQMRVAAAKNSSAFGVDIGIGVDAAYEARVSGTVSLAVGFDLMFPLLMTEAGTSGRTKYSAFATIGDGFAVMFDPFIGINIKTK